jgi:small-conductance mechanosensitive channel
MARIYSELHQNIQDRFHAEGIVIASPHFLALRDGNRVNIPREHVSDDYVPGGFRFFPLGPLGAKG